MDYDDSTDSDNSCRDDPPKPKFMEPHEIIAKADPDTKVLILDGTRPPLCNLMALDYVDILDCWEWSPADDNIPDYEGPPGYDGPIDGPDCHICKKMIIPDDERISINKVVYKLIWKEDVKEQENDEEVGVLQCMFCLNFFHRNKCSFFLSHKTYLDKKLKKSWSCANCTPVFIPKGPVPKLSKREFLISLFKFVCKLAQKNECIFNVNLDDDLDVLKNIIKITNEVDFDNG